VVQNGKRIVWGGERNLQKRKKNAFPFQNVICIFQLHPRLQIPVMETENGNKIVFLPWKEAEELLDELDE
jgi:hypothetical protein